MDVTLSKEQQKFVQWASMGANVLVDACIGSGKTTSIQALCKSLPGKNILYLTYNKLLKLDAKDRISAGHCFVTNYHGFAFSELQRLGVPVGFSDILMTYNKIKPAPFRYDLMVLDEYQDIDQDIADMLLHVRACNPGMQIVAVGDMDQKIYDHTRLDVGQFIVDFLGDEYKPMEFTQCFRLCPEWAAALGDIWEKEIVGVNPDCHVDVMSEDEVFDYVSGLDPKSVLVLGAKAGHMTDLQNRLEEECSDVWNKYTVWSKIMEQDGGATQPDPNCAVFTTYDGSKGMERDVCVLFDWSERYWYSRLYHDSTRVKIIRNIFCVAASRGKKRIILVEPPKGDLLTFDVIRETVSVRSEPQTKFEMSGMFDYKYLEDVEDCYKLLDTEQVRLEGEIINAPLSDGLIDLSSCIGNYQEASFFQNYDIDAAVEFCRRMNMGDMVQRYNTSGWSVAGKVLYVTALETNQVRYVSQVPWNFVPDWVRDQIHERLSSVFRPDEQVQKTCNIKLEGTGYGPMSLNGICDVLKDQVVYELKFVSSLSHIHFLQCACYMLAMDLKDGYLWNVRSGEMWHIAIPDRKSFLDQVVRTVTKGKASGAEEQDPKDSVRSFMLRHPGECRDFSVFVSGKKNVRPQDAEKFMDGRGLVLPIPANQFIRYFARKGGRRRGKGGSA